MKRMTEKEFQFELKKIQTENEYYLKNQKLKAEKNKYRSNNIKLPSTSKLIAVYLFMILNVVLIFAMISMWHFSDLSYLGVLITDVVAQILTYFIYAKKAVIENTVGGITYDLAMKNKDDTIM